MKEWPRYKTKLVYDIEAVQWNGGNIGEVLLFVGPDWARQLADDTLQIYDKLQDAWIPVNESDYVMKGTEGECYPCALNVFNKKYEAQNGSAPPPMIQQKPMTSAWDAALRRAGRR